MPTEGTAARGPISIREIDHVVLRAGSAMLDLVPADGKLGRPNRATAPKGKGRRSTCTIRKAI